MSTRHEHPRGWRRHPVLTTAALVALAPMMPAAVGGGDLGVPGPDEAADDAAGEDLAGGFEGESGDGAPADETTAVELGDDVLDDGVVDDGVELDDVVDDDGVEDLDTQGGEAAIDAAAEGGGTAESAESGAAVEECDAEAGDVTPETTESTGNEPCELDGAPSDVVEVVDGSEPPEEPTSTTTPVTEPPSTEPSTGEPTTGEPSKEPAKEPSKEPTKEPAKEPTKEPAKEPSKEPGKEPTKVVAPADASTTADRGPSGTVPDVGETGETGDAEGADDAGDDAEEIDVEADYGDAGLRAETYDGVYAQGVPVWVAMAATRHLESGGNYRAEARGSSASGAYQVIDSTWNRYGGYARAVDAPPAVQDQFAYEAMTAILKRHGNEVAAIPLAWYYPAALRNPSLMDVVPVPEAGNVLTPRQYQGRWMAAFHRNLEAGSPVFLPSDSDPLIPAIAFPVLGPTWFYDDWHADRDGGLRRHEGIDFLGENGQPLRAAFDGVVTRVRPTNTGRAGVGITITRADGIRANYFHLDADLRWHPDLEIGDTVKAGQVIAYMGTTGNAGIPHLHFEIRTEEGEPIAPYPAVLEAIQREQCSVGIGPWSTEFSSPATIAEQLAARIAEQAATALEPVEPVEEVEPVVHEVEGPDGARWTIVDGRAVTATGVGALVAPDQGKCTNVPEGEFGTGAGGLAIDLLPEEWWGDDVDPDDLAEMLAAVAAERSHEFDRVALDTDDAFIRMMIHGGGRLSASILQTSHELVAVRPTGDAAVPVRHVGPTPS